MSRFIGPLSSAGRRASGRKNAARKFVTGARVAELLLICDRTVRRWIRGQKIKSYQFGSARRIDVADLIAFVEQARAGAASLRTQDPLEDTFYTAKNIAEMLDVCVRTVRRRIKSGVLVAHDFHGIIRISDSDLRDFIDRGAGD